MIKTIQNIRNATIYR